MGRRGSVRAETLGKWGHEVQDHFSIPESFCLHQQHVFLYFPWQVKPDVATSFTCIRWLSWELLKSFFLYDFSCNPPNRSLIKLRDSLQQEIENYVPLFVSHIGSGQPFSSNPGAPFMCTNARNCSVVIKASIDRYWTTDVLNFPYCRKRKHTRLCLPKRRANTSRTGGIG